VSNQVDRAANLVDAPARQVRELAGDDSGLKLAVAGHSFMAAGRIALLVGLLAGCSDRPLPFPGPDMAIPGSDLVRACATVTGCQLSQLGAVGSFGSSVASCVSAFNGIERRDIQYSNHLDAATVACLSSAGADCARAIACLNGGITPSACTHTTCDGNIERDCVNGRTAAFDCGAIGLTCIAPDSKQTGACGYTACTKEYEAECVGDVVATCVVVGKQDLWVPQTDCAAIGGTCANVGVAPSCRGKGDACTMGTGPLCQDNLVVSCLGGRTAILDCTGLRQRCSGGKCVPFESCNAQPSCDGTVLTVCGPSGIESVDCAALGFVGCDATNGGRCSAR
jgi:hypothetical protein